MKTMWKYPLATTDFQTINLPMGRYSVQQQAYIGSYQLLGGQLVFHVYEVLL